MRLLILFDSPRVPLIIPPLLSILCCRPILLKTFATISNHLCRIGHVRYPRIGVLLYFVSELRVRSIIIRPIRMCTINIKTVTLIVLTKFFLSLLKKSPVHCTIELVVPQFMADIVCLDQTMTSGRTSRSKIDSR